MENSISVWESQAPQWKQYQFPSVQSPSCLPLTPLYRKQPHLPHSTPGDSALRLSGFLRDWKNEAFGEVKDAQVGPSGRCDAESNQISDHNLSTQIIGKSLVQNGDHSVSASICYQMTTFKLRYMAYTCINFCKYRITNDENSIKQNYKLMIFLAATKQLYKWYFLSVRPSVCLSHLFTMFPSSYHYEIFRSYYHGQKWCPCKRSRSKVKVTEVNT